MTCQSLHEAGEYSSFVEVRDNCYGSSWLRKVVRTRGVKGWDGHWPEVMAPGSATAATQARSHSSFPGRSSYSAAKSCRISARYDAMGRPSARNSSPNELGSTSIFAGAGHVGTCRRSTGSSSNVRQAEMSALPFQLSHPVVPDFVVGFVPEPSEPDDAHVLPQLWRRQKQRCDIRRRSGGDDGQRAQARLLPPGTRGRR